MGLFQSSTSTSQSQSTSGAMFNTNTTTSTVAHNSSASPLQIQGHKNAINDDAKVVALQEKKRAVEAQSGQTVYLLFEVNTTQCGLSELVDVFPTLADLRLYANKYPWIASPGRQQNTQPSTGNCEYFVVQHQLNAASSCPDHPQEDRLWLKRKLQWSDIVQA